MDMFTWKYRTESFYIIFFVVTLLVVLTLSTNDVVFSLEKSRIELYQHIAGYRGVSKDIVAVDIDEKSLESYGKWPWNKEIWQSLIKKVQGGGAKVIAVPIIFEDLSKFQSEKISMSTMVFAYSKHAKEAVFPAACESSSYLCGFLDLVVANDGKVIGVKPYFDDKRGREPAFSTLVAEKYGEKKFDQKVDLVRMNPYTTDVKMATISAKDVLDSTIKFDFTNKLVLIELSATPYYSVDTMVGSLSVPVVHVNLADNIMNGTWFRYSVLFSFLACFVSGIIYFAWLVKYDNSWIVVFLAGVFLVCSVYLQLNGIVVTIIGFFVSLVFVLVFYKLWYQKSRMLG